MITEGIRLAHVVSSRMPRYAPEENLQYGEWFIPAGVSLCRIIPMIPDKQIHTNPFILMHRLV